MNSDYIETSFDILMIDLLYASNFNSKAYKHIDALNKMRDIIQDIELTEEEEKALYSGFEKMFR